MAFLFDTDAISELLRPRPVTAYVKWIMRVAREEQFTSAVVIGELYKGAYRSHDRDRSEASPNRVYSIFGRIEFHILLDLVANLRWTKEGNVSLGIYRELLSLSLAGLLE